MERSHDRFGSFISLAQARNQKQFRFALLVSLVIALLLWQTQWPALRPGLIVLLVGQLSAAFAYFYRARHSASERAPAPDGVRAWFHAEQRFVEFASIGEGLFRTLGFVMLAYGFWASTGNLAITLLLGIAYPIISYFGVARRNTRQILRTLHRQEREAIT